MRPDWAPFFNDEMADFWSGEVLWNASISSYTTFRVGGAADALVFPRGTKEVSQLIQGLRKMNIPWHILGRGSNVVVSDKGIKGVVIVFGKNFSRCHIVKEDGDSVLVKVEAGHSLSGLVKWAADQGLSGLEFAAGIPGTVGGAIVMNAGAWGGEISEVVSAVDMMTERGEIVTKKRKEIDFQYRSWGEESSMVAVECVFRLKKSTAADSRGKCQELLEQRKKNQPLNTPSGGSFFQNPAGSKSAGELIEHAGLKGKRVGGAEVSHVHANFIVNNGSATAADIIGLMHIVQQRVEETSGVFLEPEVRFLGWE
ncbi:MAG: UDP-N-acetylmuramate dehydrogenase [Desulfobulbaceae bacterium]|uniref:UDP-N-acetylenolpyruvoylglucosamine reductase n=1 Tax=Candidatus Desulfobia pelagia TaxID=2841692 RepID=A0A8J6TGB1_9BACT|nr:UDP-N-acetylmuramate dehydrogenase [Candidatus Desulfobia pelagia]